MLVQVCLETSQDATWERELRALQAAGAVYQDASRWLVTLDPSPPRRLPENVVWASAASWLLGDGSDAALRGVSVPAARSTGVQGFGERSTVTISNGRFPSAFSVPASPR